MIVKLQEGALKGVLSVILGFIFFILGSILLKYLSFVANDQKVSTTSCLGYGVLGEVLAMTGIYIIVHILYKEFKK